jgi:uncharacterized protein (DUF305 family)
MTMYLVAAFSGSALLVSAAPMTAAQEPEIPATQHHTRAGSCAPAVAMGDETAFLVANDATMSKMVADMTVAPTGDIDRYFLATKVPHHQGAIDMAQLTWARTSSSSALPRKSSSSSSRDHKPRPRAAREWQAIRRHWKKTGTTI